MISEVIERNQMKVLFVIKLQHTNKSENKIYMVWEGRVLKVKNTWETKLDSSIRFFAISFELTTIGNLFKTQEISHKMSIKVESSSCCVFVVVVVNLKFKK